MTSIQAVVLSSISCVANNKSDRRDYPDRAASTVLETGTRALHPKTHAVVYIDWRFMH